MNPIRKILGDSFSKNGVLDKTCDLCKSKKAIYDGKTQMGPWAYMCDDCFDQYGVGLGVGRGQRLVDIEKKWSKR